MADVEMDEAPLMTLEPHDASILTLLARYPNASVSESQKLIGALTDDGKLVAEALMAKVIPAHIPASAIQVANSFKQWASASSPV